ncbi:MAG TPA: arylsulfatase [Burkholderiales bacterium]|nr:arylsulfatase [Burkholderiales bacterium]
MTRALRFALVLAGCVLLDGVRAEAPPNIVYLLADDLGWKDVGFHGGAIRTPHLDALAAAGARLERFYSEPYSTAARAALLTGRYPMRYGLQSLSILPWSQYGLPTSEHLLSEALKAAGYRTAMLGKWQLGHYRQEYLPTQRGFDSFYGSLNGDLDCLRKTDQANEPDWHRNARAVKEEGYCTTLLGREAARVIEGHDMSKPLFLYVAFHAPQAPLAAPRSYLDLHKDIPDVRRRAYAAMVSALDDAVGAITAALDGKKLTANTLIVFQSDNGGALPHKYPSGDGDVPRQVADNGPYRDGKGSLYEGSLRVIALASWPGKIPAGVVTERMHVTDMFPTLLHLAGAKPDPATLLDGTDQWDTLTGARPNPRKEMLLGMEDFRGALMIGDWKLIVYSRLPVRQELYNVQDDPSEEDNRADREPQRLQEMLARFNEYAWEMVPALYLDDVRKPRRHALPLVLGDNPARP